MSKSSSFHLKLPNSNHSAEIDLERHVSVSSARGSFPFLKPTHAHLHPDISIKLEWNSRDHRKGRHPLERGQRRRINTFLRLEWWNISWWVAIVFTLQSSKV